MSELYVRHHGIAQLQFRKIPHSWLSPCTPPPISLPPSLYLLPPFPHTPSLSPFCHPFLSFHPSLIPPPSLLPPFHHSPSLSLSCHPSLSLLPSFPDSPSLPPSLSLPLSLSPSLPTSLPSMYFIGWCVIRGQHSMYLIG